MLKKDKAVCLRKADYSETSQVVTLFTRSHGKISAMAKGAKRAKSSFDGPIEIFSYGDIVFAESSSQKLSTLTEFHQKPIFLGLRNRLYNLNCALFSVELVEKFTHEYDPHPELFDSTVNFLADVQHFKTDLEALSLLVIFQLTLLNDFGTKPVLNACTNCKTEFNENWRAVFFSSMGNGLVCQDCEAAYADKIRLSKNTAACLSDLRRISQADERTANEIEKILVYHFTELLGKPPRMAKHFVKR
ncbi:MAG: DNA repair protein RecO [Planctomycetes bacterium]|nr:DNA repair protein RecO [Planctomycetota bacterium]